MSCGKVIDQDDGEELIAPRLPKELRCSNSKCGSLEIDIIARSSPWCRPCFSFQLFNKFMQGIKPSKEACRPRNGQKDPANVMIAYSGGPASTVMLVMMRKYLERVAAHSTTKWTNPPEFSKIEVAHVKVGSASENQGNSSDAIEAFVESLGFTFVPLCLDDLFGSTTTAVDLSVPDLPTASTNSPANSTPLQLLLRPLTETSRVTLLSQLTHSLLVHTAKLRGHSALLKGDSQTRVAIRTIEGVALGRGWALGEEIADKVELDGLLLCRPISLLVEAELTHYLHVNNITPPHPSSPPGAKTMKKTNIPGIAEDFIIGLDASFPMTSSIVGRTAGKLKLRSGMGSKNQAPAKRGRDAACVFCGLPADPDSNEWRHAITLATLSSAPSPTTTPDQAAPNLANHACYGCLITFRDTKPGSVKGGPMVVPLPKHVSREIEQRNGTVVNGGHEGLRAMIEDCLLDD